MFNYTGLLFFQGNYLDQDTISFRSCSNSSQISDLQLFPTYFAFLTRFVALYIFKSVKTSGHKAEKKKSDDQYTQLCSSTSKCWYGNPRILVHKTMTRLNI